MGVATQQAFAEAAIYDPATGGISIYHPLVLNAGEKPAAPPVVPKLPANAVVGLWFGFNGGTLQLLDGAGKDANASPLLQSTNCVNGLSGVKGDIFGQVSWCNAEQWFTAVNAGIKSGSVVIPPLGKDKNGDDCLTSRSFAITDADPSDNLPTLYILVGNQTAQDTDANRKALGVSASDIIQNASDEALLANILDPIIGCTPFLAPSLDNPGAKVPALALSELQASLQLSPIAFVPLNDPDCLTTKDGAISVDKTNIYRLGVNQPPVGKGETSGKLQPYCDGLVNVQPAFLKGFEKEFSAQSSPDTGVGNNLFTFLCGRFLSSLDILKCPPPAAQPVACKFDANGAATSCTITLSSNTTTSSGTTTASAGTTTSADVNKLNSTLSTTSSLVTTTSDTQTTSSFSTLSAKFGNTTLAGNRKAQTTQTTSASVSVVSTAAVATTTVNNTPVQIQVITVEIVTFFVFIINLGGHLPPAVLKHNGKEGNFFVAEIEEVFIEFAPACQRACNHQFTKCSAAASKAGATFAVSDCQAQENNCLGVATTASVTASAPAKLTATATVASAIATSAKSQAVPAATTTAATGKGTGKGSGQGGAKAVDNGQCPAPTATVTVVPAAITTAVSQCTASTVVTETVTAYVTVTAPAASDAAATVTASASAGFRRVRRHAGHRPLGKY